MAALLEEDRAMWPTEKQDLRRRAEVNFAYVNSKLEHKIPELVLEGIIMARQSTVVCMWTEDPEQMASPDGKRWQDWRDNKRPSILTPVEEGGYCDFAEFAYRLLENEWDGEVIRQREEPILEMIHGVRAYSDEQLLRFNEEVVGPAFLLRNWVDADLYKFWRTGFYDCLHDGLSGFENTVRLERHEIKRALDYLKAMHVDMEDDFVWSGTTPPLPPLVFQS